MEFKLIGHIIHDNLHAAAINVVLIPHDIRATLLLGTLVGVADIEIICVTVSTFGAGGYKSCATVM